MKLSLLLLSSLLAALALSSWSTPRPSWSLPAGADWCRPVTFKVRASAANDIFANSPSPTNETAIEGFIQDAFNTFIVPVNSTKQVSGTYNIAAVYCPPRVAVNKQILQIVVHGLTYNKTFWFGLGYGSRYNYPLAAAKAGYSVLVIDRLGHGDSQPNIDPISLNQVPLQLAIYHQLIQLLKSPSSPLDVCFDQYIWCGHSFGSLFGTILAQNYVDDVDGYVLTGLSGAVSTSVTQNFNWPSASIVYPKRFPRIPLAYAVIETLADRVKAFYAGAYDPTIPVGDYRYADDFSLGEVGSLGASFGRSDFTGPVLVLAGDLDALACNSPSQTCETILANNTKDVFFPNSTYSYYVVPNTGHCFSVHYSAPTAFKHINRWAKTNFNPH